MPNITLSLDDDLLKAGRRYAQDPHTSLNALVRDLLAGTVKPSPDHWKEIFRLADKAGWSSKGKKWKREDLYDA